MSTEPTMMKTSSAPISCVTMCDTQIMHVGDCRTKIANIMKQHADTLLFYYEHAPTYRCVIPIHALTYKQCLRLLKCRAERGYVLSACTDGDEPVRFPDGVQLWPIFVEFKDLPCFENVLITGGAAEMTPYLFPNKAKRDKVFEWLLNKLSAQ